MAGAGGVVIVGAGQAGHQVAESLRREGHAGPIALIGAEPYAPYQRPPLSKAYLLGETDRARLRFRADGYHAEHAIDLQTDREAVAIDRAARTVALADGARLAYDWLVLATGARPRRLRVPGADLAGVRYLRTLDDADRIGALLDDARRVAVIGAGFIGLEFAAVARGRGKAVTVLEAAPRAMERAVSEEISAFFARAHERRGVSVRCGVGVAGILATDGRVSAVGLADGGEVAADLVVVGIGAIPNVEIAEAAGLRCDNGIVVDAFGRTDDPRVFAAGDCVSHRHPFAGRPLRLESVQNAVDQGRGVAATLVGRETPYRTVPWFWSDQYDLKLQMVGLRDGCDTTVPRGDLEDGKFSLFHYREDMLRCVESVNRPADHMRGRKLLAAGVSPTPAQAADPAFNLASLP